MTTGAFPACGTRPTRLYSELPRRRPALWVCCSPGTFNATNCPVAPYQPGELPATHRLVGRGRDQRDRHAIPGAEHQIQHRSRLQYDFSRRYSAHVGYLYTNRTIASADQTFDTGEFYFPGGAAGNAGNFFLAARGDCALVARRIACRLHTDNDRTDGGRDCGGVACKPDSLKRATILLATSPRSTRMRCSWVSWRVPSMLCASPAILSSVTTTNRSRGSIPGKCSRTKSK